MNDERTESLRSDERRGDREAGREHPHHSLRRQLSVPFLLALALSLGFLGSACFLLYSFDAVKGRRTGLAEAADAIAELTASYLEEHRRLILSLTAVVEESSGVDRTGIERRLREFHRRTPEILTLIVTDAAGTVIASERQLALGGGPLAAAQSPTVADREYFRRPRATGQPYLSDVFLGRVFGADPIVAVAVPWKTGDGGFGGIVEGSLDLTRLGRVGAIFQRFPAVEIFIVDGRSQLLWNGPARSGEPLAPVVIESMGAHLAGRPSQRSLLGTARVPGTDWTVAVQQPVREIYRTAVPQASIIFGLMLAAFVTTVLLAHSLARRVTRPLEDLSAQLDHIELGETPPALAPVLSGAPREVAVIAGSIRRLLERLAATYADLSRVLAEREATIEEEIRQRTHAEQERDQLFELGLDMLCIADFNGYFKQLNPAWERALGWPAAELMARPYIDFIHPDDLPATLREAQKLALGGATIDFENRYRTRDGGYLWLSWRAASVSGQGLIYAAARDISERKRVEKMKDDFISVVSHELRTPLTSIRGSLGLLVGGVAGELSEKARSLAVVADRNSDRLVRLVNDILDIEKIESGTMVLRPTRVDLMTVVEQAVDSNRAYANLYNVDLRIVAAVSGAAAWADADRIQQVLANLLSNAAKNSPRGTPVEIRVQHRGDELHVAVADRGKGIPLEFQPHVFEKFAQAETSSARHKGGTGLGLAISKAIIERHNGRLWFETAPGAGTTFTFALPEMGAGEPS
jgi:PAS domain S-box-containing protein